MAEATIQTDYAAQFGRGLWRYIRPRFAAAGMDSFSDPPGQNEDLFERLLNVMPPVKGDIDRRWGYRLFNTGFGVPSAQTGYPFYLYADDPQTLRRVVYGTGDGFNVADEGGISVSPAYRTTTGTVGGRGLTSRGLFYWADGVKPIWMQFVVAPIFANSKWGLAINDVGASMTSSETAATVSGAWLNADGSPLDGTQDAITTVPSGVYSNNTNSPVVAIFSAPVLISENYGFALDTVNAKVTGILLQEVLDGITITVAKENVDSFDVVPDLNFELVVGLQKQDGTIVATKVITIGVPTYDVPQTVTVFPGGATDLWGTTWTNDDFNGATFGVSITPSFNWTVQPNSTVNRCQVDVTMKRNSSGTGFAPVTLFGTNLPPTAAASNPGNVTLISGRRYAFVFANENIGTYSDLSNFSNSTGPITNLEVSITGIAAPIDPQVTSIVILATADGGDETTLYEVGRIAAPGFGTFTDNIPEETLLLANQWQSALSDGSNVGVADNTPPPPGLQYPILHRGRVYGMVGNTLWFSKSDAELLTATGVSAGRFEQCWPAFNNFPVAADGETVTGLLSDGTVLYIGTDRRVIRLFGDGPATFLQPEVLFDNVGVINQDVWKLVMLQGNPVGAMWMTPDYRVIGSDFNTYQDVGTPVQNLLDTAQSSATAQLAWASYVGISIYNLYVLAYNGSGPNWDGSQLLVFDIKGKQWYEWQLTDIPVGGFWWVSASGAPQFIFLAESGALYVFDPAALQDREGFAPVGFPAQVRTSWLAMGDQTARKVLNEIEIMTGDPQMQLTVEGGSSVADFFNPRTVVDAATPIIKPRGELGVFLAGASTRDRFYRFTFDFTNQATTDLLRSYSIQGKILHRI